MGALRKLLPNDGGETSLFMVFGSGIRAVSLHLGKRSLLVAKSRYLQLMISVLFHVQGDARIWALKNSS